MTVYTNQNIVKKLIVIHNQNFNQTMNNSAGYNQSTQTGDIPSQFPSIRGSNQWTEATHRRLVEEVERTPSPLPPEPFYLKGNFDNHPFEERKVNELVNALDKIMLHRSGEAYNTKYEI